MVGTRSVIAYRFWRPIAKENGACVIEQWNQLTRVARLHNQVLRAVVVRNRHCLGE
ncbi:Uncharacterised protein [Vibrio cholerae]|nr:Uncharacterised protein [Vibrio cholerae]CSI14078.1 Uncharacterised protein [Vibrio cholerae]